MKRTDLLRHLLSHGCELLCEGAAHSVFVNRATRMVSTVLRRLDVAQHVVGVDAASLRATPISTRRTLFPELTGQFRKEP